MEEKIKDIIRSSVDVKTQILGDQNMIARIVEVVDILVSAFKNGNRVYFCGNGGSAADAQHLAAELSGAPRKALYGGE
jgi:D-sedoheptulose 7-phosphate isomerase